MHVRMHVCSYTQTYNHTIKNATTEEFKSVMRFDRLYIKTVVPRIWSWTGIKVVAIEERMVISGVIITSLKNLV